MERDYALVGWKDNHVQAAILLSQFTKAEIQQFKDDCLLYGVDKFERIPANGVRLSHE